MRLSRVVAVGAISALLVGGADARALLGAEQGVAESAESETTQSRVDRFVASETDAIVETFASWMTAHEKTYATAEEQLRRMAIYADNKLFVQKHNAEHLDGQHGHWLAVNHLADLTRDEFSEMLGYNASLRTTVKRLTDPLTWEYANVDAPHEKDWVTDGAVTNVKNQGQCGSCWAFSTTGSVEGINFIKTGELVSVSEEELVSCSKTNGNAGCNGGLMDNALEWIVANKGIDSEQDWPYQPKEGRCGWFAKHFKKAVRIDGFADVPPNDEVALQKAVAMQPVSVAIEADHRSFQLYGGGVYDASDCGTSLDHGVLVVGYGVDDDATGHKHFWKVKNSWGDGWGEHGFIRLAKGGMGKAGQCGVASEPVYPTKDGDDSKSGSFSDGLAQIASEIKGQVTRAGREGSRLGAEDGRLNIATQ
jgi:C1A family cysteine protease